MVSTRQGTTKFALGETVLCYEPDESKAKVLYESKILEVDFTKDEKGKKVPEYFVHFSGWNKSWDRWVLEDQIVPGNEVNRQRMKKLHEEAVNRLKNRKKRKNALANIDTSKSQLNTSTTSEALSPTTPTQFMQTPISPSAPSIDIEIPCALKLKLEDDCYFIKRKKKLIHLPRSPNVIDILKEYINHVTLQESLLQPSPDVKSSVKVVKEVMDGLRVYFDFTISSLLLYNMERDQHERVMQEAALNQTRQNEVTLKEQCENSSSVQKSDKKTESLLNETKEKTETKQSIKSESVAEQSTDGSKDGQSRGRVLRRRSKRRSVSATTSSASSITVAPREGSLNAVPSRTKTSTKKGKKRKRAATSKEEEECSSTSQKSSTTTTEPSSSSLCINPSQVYGVEHLLRLFVRLPSLLAKTTIEENRLSLLLHHLTEFLSYLSTRINTLTSEDVYGDSAIV